MVPVSRTDEEPIPEGLTKVKCFSDDRAEDENQGPSCPAPLLAATSYFSSMRSRFRVRISAQPPRALLGLFREWLSLFDMVGSVTPTHPHNVFFLLIVSISYSAFPPTPRLFFIEVF